MRVLTAGVLLVGMMAAVAEAQPPARQPGGRPGGGFGAGGRDMNALVLTNEALQEELKVTTDQKEKFKGVADKQAASRKKMMELFQGGKVDREKMQEKMAELRKEGEALQTEVKAAVEGTLTADQKTRLKQIERQAAGVRAFSTEEVKEALKLTEEQTSKIKGIVEETAKDERGLFGQGGFRPGAGGFDAEKMAEIQKKRQRIQREALEKVNDALTQDQRAEWKKLVGERFDTSKLQPQAPRRKD